MPMPTDRRIATVFVPTLAAALLLASCGEAGDDPASESNPMTETVGDHADPVAGVAAPDDAQGKLGTLAAEAATFDGEAADLTVKLEALDQAVTDALPRLPTDEQEKLGQDLKSMRDAADASDWEGAQEAAASMARTLGADPG